MGQFSVELMVKDPGRMAQGQGRTQGIGQECEAFDQNCIHDQQQHVERLKQSEQSSGNKKENGRVGRETGQSLANALEEHSKQVDNNGDELQG